MLVENSCPWKCLTFVQSIKKLWTWWIPLKLPWRHVIIHQFGSVSSNFQLVRKNLWLLNLPYIHTSIHPFYCLLLVYPYNISYLSTLHASVPNIKKFFHKYYTFISCIRPCAPQVNLYESICKRSIISHLSQSNPLSNIVHQENDQCMWTF